MGEQLDGKLVSSLDEFLGFLGRTHAGWGASQDNGTGGQGSALGEEADELRNAEDEVTAEQRLAIIQPTTRD